MPLQLTVERVDWQLAIPLGITGKTFTHSETIVVRLDDGTHVGRGEAVRAGHPAARIMVDANQGWSQRHLHEFPEKLARYGVEMIEQPLPAGSDGALRDYSGPIPICADESCQTTSSLASLAGKYQFVNIKLDKTGGLTEALRLADEAQRAGLRLMVGCMLGTSLSTAPAFIAGQRCELVDLDSPLLLTRDVEHGLKYSGSQVGVPAAALWG